MRLRAGIIQRLGLLATFGLAGLPLTGCDGSGTTGAVTRPSVTITPDPLTLYVGSAEQLETVLRDAVGPIAWSTADSTIATVSGTGVATAIRVGTTRISATAAGTTGTMTVSVTAIPLLSFASVAAGGAHTCALTAAGAAWCWGRGESGQLGVPAPTATCAIDAGSVACSMVRVAVRPNRAFTRLTAGGAHTCGLAADGSAFCWGNNTRGQLGDGSTTSRDTPVRVATALRFAGIDAGNEHTCAVAANGAAYCWGSNQRGQLGDASTSDRSAPVPVGGGLAFTQVAAGGYTTSGHTCGVARDGAAFCWGDNTGAQLGIGTADGNPHPAPVAVAGGRTFVTLVPGLSKHTCGLTPAGAAYCWGDNPFGAVGDGSEFTRRASPVAVSGGISFAQLVAGGFIGHTCGLTTGGVAYCWGENEVGALGNASEVDGLVPTPVAGSLAFTGLTAGFRHTCGRASTGAVYCWGSGRTGQLGTGSSGSSSAPVRVSGQP